MNQVIASDNGLSPILCQAIISSKAGLLSIGPLGTNFSEISIKILNSSFTKKHLKKSSAKWRPFCPGGDELRYLQAQWWPRWVLHIYRSGTWKVNPVNAVLFKGKVSLYLYFSQHYRQQEIFTPETEKFFVWLSYSQYHAWWDPGLDSI